MAIIDIGNISETIGFNDFEVSAELLELASIYDGAVLKFLYNQNSDLSNDTVTAESFTSDVGNLVDLVNNNIDTVTEVRDETSAVLVEDTDYEIDYANGKIKILDTTDTSDGASYEIDYTHGPTLFTQGLFALGSKTQNITGLTEGETYYYKVVGDTVAYNSSASMENALKYNGFIDDYVIIQQKLILLLILKLLWVFS